MNGMNKARKNRLIAESVVGCRIRSHVSRGSGRTLYDLVIPGGVDGIDFVTEEGAWRACPDFLDDPTTLHVILRAMANRDCRLEVIQEDAAWWSARFTDPRDPPGVDGCDGSADGKTLQQAVAEAALLRVKNLVPAG